MKLWGRSIVCKIYWTGNAKAWNERAIELWKNENDELQLVACLERAESDNDLQRWTSWWASVVNRDQNISPLDVSTLETFHHCLPVLERKKLLTLFLTLTSTVYPNSKLILIVLVSFCSENVRGWRMLEPRLMMQLQCWVTWDRRDNQWVHSEHLPLLSVSLRHQSSSWRLHITLDSPSLMSSRRASKIARCTIHTI